MKSNKCSSASLQGNQRRRDVDSDAGADWPVRRGLTPVRSRLWRRGRRLQGHGGCSGPHVQVAQPRPHPSSSQDLSVK